MAVIATYLRVLGLLNPERRTAAALCCASLAVAAAQCLEPVLLGRAVGLLSSPPGGAIWTAAVRLLGLWALCSVAGIGANTLVALFADRLAHSARMRALVTFLSRVVDLPASFHASRHSGEIGRVMFGGADTMFNLWLGLFREHTVMAAGILVLLPVAVAMNWRLSLVLVALSAAYGGMTWAVVANTRARQGRVEAHHREMGRVAQDILSNIPLVRAFTRSQIETSAFGDLGRATLQQQFPVLAWWAVATTMARTVGTVATLTLVAAGILLHSRGEASVGEVVSFLGFSSMLIGRLEAAVWFFSGLARAAPSVDEWFAVTDIPAAAPRPACLPGEVRGEVRFENVCFTYPDGSRALDGISFSVGPGRTVALVGRTGAGKSTTAALLRRDWQPTSGRILLDGTDIADVDADFFRRAVAAVHQDSLMFDRSILENVRVGRPDSSDADVESVCREAEAHEFIVAQPEGYATVVGERGMRLSGGQRQRLSIARAMLRDAPVLVMDEATSALDSSTEAKVAAALGRLSAGRTTVVVAHRLSTVMDADEILVFEAGRIVERGDFRSLTRARGLFADLAGSQLAAAGGGEALAA